MVGLSVFLATGFVLAGSVFAAPFTRAQLEMMKADAPPPARVAPSALARASVPEGSVRARFAPEQLRQLLVESDAGATTKGRRHTVSSTGPANNLVVDPSNLNGWEISNTIGGPNTNVGTAATPSGTDGFFATGYAAPPLGAGSFRQIVGTNGNDAQRMRTGAYNGTRLDAITTLKYSTYVDRYGSGGQATYLQLAIDQDGNGTTDDILFFEPVYQDGGYGWVGTPGTTQAALALDTWQEWDAAAGGWWSLDDATFGPPLKTLATYRASFPDAQITTASLGFRLVSGTGAGAWDNFRGAFDKVQVNKDTYDFESVPVTLVATPGNLQGWEIANFDNATLGEVGSATTTSGTDGEFVLGPDTPPSGAGSFFQVVGTDGDDATRLRTSAYNGMPLAEIFALKYWTYVSQYGSNGQASYLQVRVDFDNDGDFDDILFFEPVYQDGNYGGDPFPAQPALTLNTWQQWDALAGGWWSLNDNTGGPPLRTITNYVEAHPGAKLITDAPAIRLQAGFGGAAWDDFRGNFDVVQINKETYDFENVTSNVVVTTASPNGWSIQNFDATAAAEVGSATTTSGTDGDFAGGPGTPPSGSGSFSQVVGTNGDDATRVWTSAYNGLLLADLAALSYWTHVTQYGSNGQATYLQIRVDFDGDGDFDDRLFFEPVYQDGGYSGDPFPAQPALTLGTWQQWNARDGGWWSENDGFGGPPLRTIDSYIATHPGARLITNAPAIRVQAGGGGTAWDDFIGNFDVVQINKEIYDFEFTPTPTTTVLTSDVNPSNCGGKVNLTATLSPSPATGTVEFFDGGASLGTASVSAGGATLSVTTLPAGHRTLTATYSGDALHTGSTSSVLVQNVHCTPTGTTTVLTTPCNPQGWFPNNVLGGGSVAITGTYPHATGSLEFNTTSGSSKADFVRPNGNADLLSTLSALAVDLYRNSSSTTTSHFAPAVRLFVDNGQATNRFSYLIWEPVYNGYPTFPTDTWGTYDLFKGNFWQRAFKTTPPNRTIEIYNRALADWLQPGTVTDGGGNVSNEVGPSARVLAVEIGVGSGWVNAFAGAADNFRIGFAGADSVFDFEVTRSTSLVLTAPATSTCGDKIVLAADLTPAGLAATIDFFDGATPLGSAPVDANGHAELSVMGLAVGDHTLTASYAGAPCVSGSTSIAVGHRVDAIATTTTLTPSPSPSAYGETVTLTASIVPTTATGTVSFYDQTGPAKSLFKSEPAPLFQSNPQPVNLGMRFYADVAGLVTGIRYYKDAGNTGPHTVALWTDTGTLLATAVHTPAPGARWEEVTLPAPVAIAANTNYITAYHSASGFSYTTNYFDAHSEHNAPLHAPENTGVTPNGVYQYGAANQFPVSNFIGSSYWVDVVFKPATALGTEPVAGGQAQHLSSTLSVGTHSLVAVYSGDACHAASASAKTAHEVIRATPIMMLVSDNDPAERNEKVNLTATLSALDATGTVTFYDGANPIGTEPVSSGAATLSISTLSAGTHSVTAQYSGDANYEPATSNKLDQDVDLLATTTTLVASPVSPTTCGQKITLTATVDPTGGSGTVEFFEGANSLGSGTPTGPNTFELSVTSLAPGSTYSLTAVFSGDGKYAGSTSAPLSHTVDKLPTTVTLQSSNPDIKEGSKITLTANVSPTAATGTVEFKDAANSLGTSPVQPDGSATLSVASLTPGSHMLTAEYSGDACYQARVSDPIKQDIQVDDAPVVTVTSPNGGEDWVVGTTHKVSWTATDDNSVAYVDLYVSRDNGTTWELVEDMEVNDGTYDWLVTGPGTNGPDGVPVFTALWKVVATDNTMRSGEDQSNAGFSIFDGAVPTLLSTFFAQPTGVGIELRWSFAAPGELRDITVERSDRIDGVWTRVDGETRRDGEMTVALDRTAMPGRTYYYRLVATRITGQRLVFGPLVGTAGAAFTDFALAPARPNPSRGPTSIEFTVPRETSLRLAVVDVQGREVASLAAGVHRAGRYQVTWDGTNGRGRAPVGLYFVRFSAGGRVFTQRLVLAR